MIEKKEHPFTIKKKFSHSLIDSLKKSKLKKIREGEVYCIRYSNDEFPTDKHHQLAIVYVTEIRNNEIVGYNLLYLGSDTNKKLLERAIEIKTLRGSTLDFLIQNELTRTPWVYARKVFQPAKIVSFAIVERNVWDQLYDLDKKPFGNLNEFFLTRDWVAENTSLTEKKKRKKVNDKEPLQKEESFTIEENMNAREIVFDEVQEQTLQDFTKDTIDFGDDDI